MYLPMLFSIVVPRLCFSLIASALEPSPLIVGGRDAADRQFPYQVSLRVRNQHFYGGSVLTNRWILTAAHCLTAQQDENVTVVVGTNYLVRGGDAYIAKRMIPHEKYVAKKHIIGFDIGLIQVSESIRFTDSVRNISILDTANFEKTKYPAVLSGWGLNSIYKFQFNTLPNELQFLETNVITVKDCRVIGTIVNSSHICTWSGPGKGACNVSAIHDLVELVHGIC